MHPISLQAKNRLGKDDVNRDVRNASGRRRLTIVLCFSFGLLFSAFRFLLLATSAPLSSLTGAIGETAASLDIKPSDLLRRLSGRVATATGPAEEAVVDEECPKCKRKGLSYHTAQLRGLDEGQTIFYTCLNEDCKHKYNINS